MWVKVSVPFAAPAAVGAKLTLTVQLPAVATEPPAVQLTPLTRKALLLGVNDARLSAALPVFDSVTICEALVAPTLVAAKLRLVGAALAIGAVATPVPLSATLVVVGLALCVKVSVPLAAPAALGAKLTLTAQLPPAATEPPLVQLRPVTANALLLVAKDDSDKAAPPVFDSVTVCAALVLPMVVEAKLSVVGAALAAAVGAAAPLPLKATVVVFGLALCVKLSVPLAAPTALGAKLTLTLQLPPAATDPPEAQLTALTMKAGLLVANEVNVNAAVPGFDSVTVCAALLLPTLVDAKVSVLGAALAAGAVAAAPVPLRATEVVVGLALCVKVSVPLAAPEAVGTKLTLTVQLPAAATEPPFVQVTPVARNAVLLVASEDSVNAAVPVFDNVTVCDALVLPTTVDAKLSVVGEALAAGVPLPARVTLPR